MIDRQRLEYLRSTLFKVTPLRAEDLDPGELEENGWFVDVFRPTHDDRAVGDPILDIVERIAWSDRAITIGLTGGMGAGKTTQIGRLRKVAVGRAPHRLRALGLRRVQRALLVPRCD